jgi:hypothetical protein
MAIEPSDILTITAADTEYTVKVTEISMQADCRLTIGAVNLLTDEDMYFNADAGSPSLPYAGNVARMGGVEGADTFQATQYVGMMWAMDGQDTFVARLVTLVLAATDRPDGFTGVGPAPGGNLAATDRPDRLLATTDFKTLDLDFTTMG